MHAHAILQHYGYVGVAVALILEFLFIPFPAETILIVSGVMWRSGFFHLIPLIIVSTCASWVGSMMAYWLGGLVGRPVLVRYGKYIRLDEQNLLRTEHAFRRYSFAILGIGRFIAGIRVLIAYVAGMNEMGIVLYSVITFISAALWASAFIMIGGTIGAKWHVILLWIMHHPWLSSLIVIAVAIVLYLIERYRRQRKKLRVEQPS